MKFQVVVSLTADREQSKPKVLYEGFDWTEVKESFAFWSNEYRDEMDRICIRKRP